MPSVPGHATTPPADALYLKARKLLEDKKYDQAIVAFNRLFKISPTHLEALISMADLLLITGKPRPALTAYQQALRLAPAHPEIFNGIANCHLALGEIKDAQLFYRKGLKVFPDSAELLYNLVLVSNSISGLHTQQLHTLYKRQDCTGRARMMVCFALGQLSERQKHYSHAFRYYHEAKKIRAALSPYSEAAWFDFYEKLQVTYTPDLLARLHNPEHYRITPIFVLGMPRSGTSLVEQILASHSGVFGAGEVNILSQIAEHLIPELTMQPYPAAITALDEKLLKALAANYMQRLSAYCPSDSTYVVDKTPINFCHIGLIRILFPHAIIIHCRRDPMDTCWSIFKQNFADYGHPYSNDLGSLGRFYRRYQSLMQHWHHVLPGVIHDVEYEKMVEQPEAVSRALLAHCHLPWEDNCLNFYQTKRIVSTASALQVRRPIYKDALKSWEPLARELAPLRTALQLD